jgi:hypothetical protein
VRDLHLPWHCRSHWHLLLLPSEISNLKFEISDEKTEQEIGNGGTFQNTISNLECEIFNSISDFSFPDTQ